MLHKNLLKVLSIGYGSLGKPLVDTLVQNGNNVSVVTKSNIPKDIPNNFQGIKTVKGTYDIILLSTKQSQIESVLSEMPESIYNKDTVFVSTLPGTTREYFYNHFGNSAKVALLSATQNNMSKWTLSLLADQQLPIFHELGKVYYLTSYAEMQKMKVLNGSGIALAYELIKSHQQSIRNMNLGMSEGEVNDLTLSLFESGMNLARNNVSSKLDSTDILNRAVGNTDTMKFGGDYGTRMVTKDGAQQLCNNMITAAKMSIPDFQKQKDLVQQCEEFSCLA